MKNKYVDLFLLLLAVLITNRCSSQPVVNQLPSGNLPNGNLTLGYASNDPPGSITT